MEATRVLHRLHQRGIHLRVLGNAIVAAPRDALTDELRGLIRSNKPAILEALGAGTAALESRRRRTEEQLRNQPGLVRAFDIAGAPLLPEAGPSVSVVLAVRTVAGIVSGELRIPRENFYSALIIRALEAPGKPS